MSDAIARLNAALEGRYTIERELGEGGMATVLARGTGRAFLDPGHVFTASEDHSLPVTA